MATIPGQKLHKITDLYQAGNSAKQISLQLGYSLHAVYYIMRKYKVKRRTLKECAALQFVQKTPSFSILDRLTPNQRELKTICVTLYWAEGYKTTKSKGIDFANSDPAMIYLFLRFLREICQVDNARIRILLYSHSNDHINQQITYWSSLLSIPKSQFSKPYIAKTSAGLEKKSKMPYGLVHLRYADKKLLLRMLNWIEDLKQ
jgi:hypothetical protein